MAMDRNCTLAGPFKLFKIKVLLAEAAGAEAASEIPVSRDSMRGLIPTFSRTILRTVELWATLIRRSWWCDFCSSVESTANRRGPKREKGKRHPREICYITKNVLPGMVRNSCASSGASVCLPRSAA